MYAAQRAQTKTACENKSTAPVAVGGSGGSHAVSVTDTVVIRHVDHFKLRRTQVVEATDPVKRVVHLEEPSAALEEYLGQLSIYRYDLNSPDRNGGREKGKT